MAAGDPTDVLGLSSPASGELLVRVPLSGRFGNGSWIFAETASSVRRYRRGASRSAATATTSSVRGYRHNLQAGTVGANIGAAAPVAFFPF